MKRVKKRLKAIAENMPLVYEAGMAQGGDTEGAYNAGYNAGFAEGHGAGYEQGETAGYNAGYEKGKAEGGDSENLKGIISCGLLYDFRNYTGESIDAESDLALSYTTQTAHGTSTARYGLCSNNQNLKECKVIFPNATIARFSFYDCHNLEYLTVDMTKVVDATSGYTGFNSTFRYCYALKRIDGQISLLNCDPENTFSRCDALEYVAFLPNSINKSLSLSDSSNFSAEGIQTLINALVTITDGVARTITFHATVKGKLTDEQKATITTTKGWTLA